MHIPPGYALFIPSAIRKAVDLPVVGVGRFKDPLQAERALAEGHCDLVGVVRGQIADADFAAKARAGATDEIRLCLSCNQECVGRMGLNRWLGCIENPRTGREAEHVGAERAPAGVAEARVMVVGAGPGRAAGRDRRGAQRPPGDGATSSESQAGGQVRLAASVPNRAEFGDMIRNQLTECRRLGVTIEYGVGVWPGLVDRAAARPRDRRHRRRAAAPVVGAGRRRPTCVDVRDVLDGSAEPVRRRRGDRRDRLPPGHLGRRAAGRPRLPASRSSPTAWSSARTSASPSTWRTGGCGPAPRASCSRPTSCRWACDRHGDARPAAPPDRRQRSTRTPDWVVLAVPASPVEWLYHDLKAAGRERRAGRRLRRPAPGPRRRDRGRARRRQSAILSR